MKIEKEMQREKKKEEKRRKSEQMKILGKDKSRPKLSFTLKN
jgi:arginine and glutamate-rich protein 1